MPGGPISVRIAPERLSSAMPRSCAELADGQVLDDPVLDVLEAGVVGVEHLARVDGVEPLLGALAPRHGEQPVEVGADHRRLAALVAHPLEPRELALGLLAHGVGHAGLGDLRAVVVGDGRVVLAELLADRLHLLAQEVLALLLALRPPRRRRGCAGAPAARRAARAGAAGRARSRSTTSTVSSSSIFCSKVSSGAYPAVSASAPVSRIERTNAAMRPSSPRSSRISSTTARYSRSSSRVCDARRLLVGPLVDLDAQAALRVGVGGAGDPAVQARRG